ncbi:MAG: superoxide dismutase [Deltaproteobacteria bacterium CG11_big_fil_rev_8_21_14_0_20_42_23]|nr:MAG: superoxide dismutase [Deltaproteobacteria bacterium CG11_big_fil_rev_8_21_14_0_20_42_23]PJC63531.1 MAG: superoxide dismutase [Deltaproteobacteria bacterium CG_4_9_14_0_2_um_filter_42_21]
MKKLWSLSFIVLLLACASRTEKAVAIMHPASGSNVQGKVEFTQGQTGVLLSASISGLTPGLHGFHIHENGDCSAENASTAGGHFNPEGARHGSPLDASHHMGDMGNLLAKENGVAEYEEVLKGITLKDVPNNILGRSLIIHAATDDFTSQPSGNSGSRIACGVIKLVK